MYKLEVTDLHKRYGSHEVLKGVSLAAKAGDVISCLLYTSPSPRDS